MIKGYKNGKRRDDREALVMYFLLKYVGPGVVVIMLVITVIYDLKLRGLI